LARDLRNSGGMPSKEQRIIMGLGGAFTIGTYWVWGACIGQFIKAI